MLILEQEKKYTFLFIFMPLPLKAATGSGGSGWQSFKMIEKCKLFDTFEWYKYIGRRYKLLNLSRFPL
jgi:hypothetical protein